MKLTVNKTEFVDHIKRICRRNLKVPCKICIKCPFLLDVLEVMEANGWKYNEKVLEDNNEKD